MPQIDTRKSGMSAQTSSIVLCHRSGHDTIVQDGYGRMVTGRVKAEVEDRNLTTTFMLIIHNPKPKTASPVVEQ
eukprot:scaffold59924_cov18-Prasinocladus_malaysianus.AAC.1